MKATAFAEAPAKTILTGEHFVVHGSHALAAAVGRTVRVRVVASDRLAFHSQAATTGNPEVRRPLEDVIRAMAHEFAISPELDVTIQSEIPPESGMGSSAATLVAMVSAVSAYHSLALKKEEVVKLAMAGERVIHGRPSGIDPTICTYGGVILFRMGEAPKPIRLSHPFDLILAHSGVRRRTKAQVSRVSELAARHKALFTQLAESVDELSLMAADRLAKGDRQGLAALLSVNHSVLRAVGVSTGSLDSLVDTLLRLGCPGAKLTGGGGGGTVVAIPPKGKSIIGELAGRGFDAFEARIPVAGVRSWLRRS